MTCKTWRQTALFSFVLFVQLQIQGMVSYFNLQYSRRGFQIEIKWLEIRSYIMMVHSSILDQADFVHATTIKSLIWNLIARMKIPTFSQWLFQWLIMSLRTVKSSPVNQIQIVTWVASMKLKISPILVKQPSLHNAFHTLLMAFLSFNRSTFLAYFFPNYITMLLWQSYRCWSIHTTTIEFYIIIYCSSIHNTL